jgi:polyhydroxyalkanoate synthesis regulator phasin
MPISKRTLIAGAAVAAVGLAGIGGVGLASAATNSNSTGTSIVDKIATKFNLNKDEVQAVFDEEHKEHRAEMQQDRADRLAESVKDGKLTQEQADYITAAFKEIESLMGNARPGEQSDGTHEQIKAKMDALHTWAKENDVDLPDLVFGAHSAGHGGHGGGAVRFEHKVHGPHQVSTDSQND